MSPRRPREPCPYCGVTDAPHWPVCSVRARAAHPEWEESIRRAVEAFGPLDDEASVRIGRILSEGWRERRERERRARERGEVVPCHWCGAVGAHAPDCAVPTWGEVSSGGEGGAD